MAKIVAKDLASLFPLDKNPAYVDPEKLTNALNLKLLNGQIISPEIFNDKLIEEAYEIIYQIICLSIDKRVETIGSDQANKMLKEIMIQNLDYQ